MVKDADEALVFYRISRRFSSCDLKIRDFSLNPAISELPGPGWLAAESEATPATWPPTATTIGN
jgi:hypothetical protein